MNTNKDFIFSDLKSKTIQEMADLAIFYRNDKNFCLKILNYAMEQAENQDSSSAFEFVDPNSKENIQILLLGVHLQYMMDCKPLLNLLKHTKDKRLDLLRGIIFMNNGQLDEALFWFNKIQYRKGIDIINLKKNNKIESDDDIVKCFQSSKNWKREFNTEGIRKDFLYRINKSDEYENEDNVDVIISSVERSIEAGKLNGVIAKLESLESINSQEVYYLLGKVYHIQGDYDKAVHYYELSCKDRDYIPARFNLCRIQGTPFKTKISNSSVADYNALLSLKNKKKIVDISNCSNLVSRISYFCNSIKDALFSKTSTNLNFEEMENHLDLVALRNNKGILESYRNTKNAISIFEDLLSGIVYDPSVVEYLKYNLGCVKQDTSLLQSLDVPEAKFVLDLLNNNLDTENSDLKCYLFYKNDRFHELPESNGFFYNLLLGIYNLDKNPTKAELLLSKITDSPDSANGLGILALKENKIQKAIKYFKSVEMKINVDLNLGLAYFMDKKWNKSIEYLINEIKRGRSSPWFYDVIVFLVREISDVVMINSLIGIKEEEGKSDSDLVRRLNREKALILLKSGSIKEVKEMKLDDEDIQNKIREKESEEEIRKTKMKEIEEYRKRRNFGN